MINHFVGTDTTQLSLPVRQANHTVFFAAVLRQNDIRVFALQQDGFRYKPGVIVAQGKTVPTEG
ncbi:hypothetical protein V3529_16255 [Serratia marcescens]|uniref:hypothetical protein n=1 Tax=Serratia marcescens TaxID=615 RepID=UPI001639E91B|nr:hypothetical protein [Serratia marcescens]EMD6648148.1 hypothetical protein [Serratia marcescens]MDH2252939.1 hypothetical protein [Serratia marcescens]MDH2253656.1 hypothetical protein [Serratia marcescens]MDH2262882.1 hypothetical protein [Serratia marcescens]